MTKYVVKLTPRAKQDVLNIGRYTSQQWGKKQRDAYLRGLDETFRAIASNPDMGRERSDIRPGYHSFPFKSHVVFYLKLADHIAIIGILHQSIDVDSRL